MSPETRGERPLIPRRRLVFLLAGGLAWGIDWSGWADDGSLARVRQAGRLRIRLDPSYPPFANADAAGQLDGFDVELARELAARLGVAPELVALDVGGLLDAVVARRCDIAMGVSPARELLRDLRFSRPYFDDGQVLVARAAPGKPVGPGFVVGVESGSGADAQGAGLAAQLGGVELRRLASVEALAAGIQAGQLDGILVDATTGHELVKAQRALAIAAGPLTRDPIVVAAHRRDGRLVREIDAVLDRLEREGYLAGLTARWLG